jgi:hypothetical protein
MTEFLSYDFPTCDYFKLYFIFVESKIIPSLLSVDTRISVMEIDLYGKAKY